MIFAAAFDQEPVEVFDFLTGEFPGYAWCHRFCTHVLGGSPVLFHNAGFDRLIWPLVYPQLPWWPSLGLTQIRCTMVMAASMALPLSLENMAASLGISAQKDSRGHRVMLKWAKPFKGRMLEPRERPDEWNQVLAYARTDVRVMQEAFPRLRALSPRETSLWQLDQIINDRGIPFCRAEVERCRELVEEETGRAVARVMELTDGAVTSGKAPAQWQSWLQQRGVTLPDLRAETVRQALREELPADVREALELRPALAKSSIAKLEPMLRATTERMRGCYQFNGAGQTGRWGGRRFQPQNLERGNLTPGQVHMVLRAGRTFGAPVLPTIGSCIRGLIQAPPGRVLVAVDLAQIECRAVAYLAGEGKILEIFRTHGMLYEATAAELFHTTIDAVKADKALRLRGKVAVLALGYCGGVGALLSMGPGYGLYLTEEEAQDIVNRFRARFPALRAWGMKLERAAQTALRHALPVHIGKDHRRVTYRRGGSFLGCKLPSERWIYYPFPRVERVMMPWGDEQDAVTYQAYKNKQTYREKAWAGLFSENVTQAYCRDLFAHGMLQANKRGLKIVMHTHDECVVECDESYGTRALELLKSAFTQAPEWAPGFPLAVDGWIGRRYRK